MAYGSDRSFADVLQDIIGNVQEIVRAEVRLAKREIKEETLKVGNAARVLVAGIVLALYAAGFLFLTWVYALESVLPPWLAAFIVTMLLATAGAILIGAGRNRLKTIDPKVEKTVETVKENIAWVKHQTK